MLLLYLFLCVSLDNEMAAQMMLESGSSSTTKEAAEASPFSEDSEKSNFVGKLQIFAFFTAS